MGIGMTNPGLWAGGNISPARFVVPTTQPYFVIQAVNATVQPAGVSGEFVRYAPGTPFDDGFIATASQQVLVHGPLEQCNIETGASFNPMVYLKSDGNGRAILATTGTYVGARAFEGSTASGQRIKCQPMQGYFI